MTILQWKHLLPHLAVDSQDLVEVIFTPMTDDCWRRLFVWLPSNLLRIEMHDGCVDMERLNLESFINGEAVYVVDIKGVGGMPLSLSLIDREELVLDISVGELVDELRFKEFIHLVTELKGLIGCDNYFICHEFKRMQPFIINGVLVES